MFAVLTIGRALLSISYSFALIGFSYILPALFSVKAVVHNDSEAYKHLPRYRGASVLYRVCVTPLVDRYEERIDAYLNEVYLKVRRRVWANVASTGWSFLDQIKMYVQIFQGEAPLSAAIPFVTAALPRMETTVAAAAASERNNNLQKRRRVVNPQHSVEALHSMSTPYKTNQDTVNSTFDSYHKDESTIQVATEQTFIRDFSTMLQRGLFVFAHVDESHSIYDDDDRPLANTQDSLPAEKIKKFQLRVFSYEEEPERCFLLSSVDSNVIEDGVSLYIHDIKTVAESGTQGIQFFTVTNTGVMAEIVLSSTQDRDTLLHGLTVYLSFLKPKDTTAGETEDSVTFSMQNVGGRLNGSTHQPLQSVI